MNTNIDYQLPLQRRHAYERITLGHITNEESYLWRWSPRLSLPGVRVELKKRELWKEFHAENTEMIITKSGRRMFPSMQITVHGLSKHSSYYAIVEIVLASDRRHKYCGNGEGNDNEKKNENKNIRGWSFAGPAEPQSQFERRIFCHPDSPATGEYWMQNSISFSKLKLTNNVGEHHNNVVLTSMHKYIPKIWLIRCSSAPITLDKLFSHPASVFTFKETEFIAVTAYQNANITKLKIDNNPFAKGFRETGQSRCKRKNQSRPDEEEESNSDSSDSNPGANNLDDLAKKFSNTGNSDDYDDAKPSILIAEDEELPSTSGSTHQCETSSPFHRPWLDSPSHKKLPSELIPSVSSLSSTPLFLSEDYDRNYFRFDFDHYLQALSFEQQYLLKYYQYYYATL